MSAQALLERARAAGVSLFAEGEQIRYRGPALAVNALVPELRAHKAELLAALDHSVQLDHAPPTVDEVGGHWLVIPASGKPTEMYFSPDISRDALAKRFPATMLILLADTTEPAPPSA